MTPDRFRRAQEMFASAVGRAPEARAAYLDGACDGDLELRREVESLLASHEAAPDGFPGMPAIEGMESVSQAVPPSRKPLTRGARLGSFEILGPLGSGGMGEVYRAKDPRLGRDVAIKVLPGEVAEDRERLKRFEKEARSASALNHPNIVTIYETGSSDGVPWIAMEHVEGDTLRKLLAEGAIQTKKLLNVAVQIAEGLARAHEAGIVHRDLKPENVMVTKDGLVKILDFGLAKLSGPMSGGSDEESQLPTVTGTSPGIVLGTVGYMSPEQASGKAVDFRSDQFALGSMLYEMATGRRAFQKKTAVDTLAAILNEEPDPVATQNPQAPAPLRWIVERCLQKEPRQRYSATDDLARELAGVRDHLSELSSSVSAAGGRIRSRGHVLRPSLGVGAALVLILAGGLAHRLLSSKGAAASIPALHRITFRRGNVLTARFTPDGQSVVYGAAWDGALLQGFSVRIDSRKSESVPISEPRQLPLAVSSRGELAVLLRSDNGVWGGRGVLARMPLSGGAPRELMENVLNADWAPNGEDLAVVHVLPDGKTEIQYPIGTVLAKGDGIVGAVRISPDGNLVAFMDGGALVTVDRGGKRRVVSQNWASINEWVWSSTGSELILAGTRTDDRWSIFSVSLSGRERVLLPSAFDLVCLYDVAADGRLLVEASEGRGSVMCRRRGEDRERDVAWLASPGANDLSEDGGLILFPNGYLRKTDGTPAVRICDCEAQAISADGKWVLALQGAPHREMVLVPTGPGTARKIPVQGLEPLEAWLLPAGKGYVIRSDARDGNPVLSVVGPGGGRPTLLQAEDFARNPGIAISPEGDRLAYSTKSGQLRIIPTGGGPGAAIPAADSWKPNDSLVQWGADGRTLYVARQGRLPVAIDQIEVLTGRRSPWKSLEPADPTGIQFAGAVLVSRDGQSYAYSSYVELTSDLYVVEGLK